MKKHKKKRGRTLAPAFLNVIGLLLLQIVLLVLLPMAIQNFKGYSLHNVENDAMEPTVLRGSLIIVRDVPPEEVQEGDVILFAREGKTLLSRVSKIHPEVGEYIMQGDAEAQEDTVHVSFEQLVGRMTWHIPSLGPVMVLMTTPLGKLYMGLIILCGFLLMIVADRLRQAA